MAIYSSEFLVALEDVHTLFDDFRSQVDQRVSVLLGRIGVQGVDSANFFEHHVMPVLTKPGSTPPEKE